MIAPEIIQQLQQASLTDRLQMIEILFQTLKYDISRQNTHPVSTKPFIVHTFNLGTVIPIVREEMYAQRVF